MKQSNEQPIESVQSSKNIWITVIAVIITALIVGGGVYAWQRSNLKNTEQTLQQQISVLQNKISQLEQAQTNQNQQADRPVDEQDEPAPIANWETYTNSSRGYSVQYPTNLDVDDSNLDQISIGSPVVPYVNITVYQGKQNTDLQSFVQEKLIDEFNGLLTANEINWVTIDNDFTKIGVKFPSKVGGYDGELYWVYIDHNYKVYKIAVLTDYDDMTQSEFQNKIMSGFKFTD